MPLFCWGLCKWCWCFVGDCIILETLLCWLCYGKRTLAICFCHLCLNVWLSYSKNYTKKGCRAWHCLKFCWCFFFFFFFIKSNVGIYRHFSDFLCRFYEILTSKSSFQKFLVLQYKFGSWLRCRFLSVKYDCWKKKLKNKQIWHSLFTFYHFLDWFIYLLIDCYSIVL